MSGHSTEDEEYNRNFHEQEERERREAQRRAKMKYYEELTRSMYEGVPRWWGTPLLDSDDPTIWGPREYEKYLAYQRRGIEWEKREARLERERQKALLEQERRDAAGAPAALSGAGAPAALSGAGTPAPDLSDLFIDDSPSVPLYSALPEVETPMPGVYLLDLSHFERYFNTKGYGEIIPKPIGYYSEAVIVENFKRAFRFNDYFNSRRYFPLFRGVTLVGLPEQPLIYFVLYHSELKMIRRETLEYERVPVPDNTTVIQFSETFYPSDLSVITNFLLSAIKTPKDVQSFYKFLTDPTRENVKKHIFDRGFINTPDHEEKTLLKAYRRGHVDTYPEMTMTLLPFSGSGTFYAVIPVGVYMLNNMINSLLYSYCLGNRPPEEINTIMRGDIGGAATIFSRLRTLSLDEGYNETSRLTDFYEMSRSCPTPTSCQQINLSDVVNDIRRRTDRTDPSRQLIIMHLGCKILSVDGRLSSELVSEPGEIGRQLVLQRMISDSAQTHRRLTIRRSKSKKNSKKHVRKHSKKHVRKHSKKLNKKSI